MRTYALMQTRNSNRTSKRVFFLLLQFLILLGSFIYLDFIYMSNVRPDQFIKQTFVKTDCLIMSKKLSTKGKYIRRSRADFLINYHAKGVQYNRWVSGNGLDMSYSRNGQSQEQLLSDYKVGGNYGCWYNPENSEVAVLVLRQGWSLAYPLVLPAVVGLMALLLFMKNGLILLGIVRPKKTIQSTL